MAVRRQRAAGLEAVPGERQLHGDVRRDGGELAPLGDHRVLLDGDHLGGDGAIDDLADFGDDVCHRPAGLRDQGGVGRHPVQHAGVGERLDLGNVGRVYEELHRVPHQDR